MGEQNEREDLLFVLKDSFKLDHQMIKDNHEKIAKLEEQIKSLKASNERLVIRASKTVEKIKEIQENEN